jgi:hypothetical protein
MYPLKRILFLTFAAVGSLVMLSSSGVPARAGDMAQNSGPLAAAGLPQNLGPVGADEAILTDVGTKRVLAWYQPAGGGCAVNAVVWNRADVEGTSTAGIRIRLDPGQIVHFDSAYNVKSLGLKCADDASTLSIVDNEELVAFDIQRTPSIRANASGY